MPGLLSLSEDRIIGGLARVVEAVILTNIIDRGTALRLKGFAKAIKLYAEAGERASARKVVEELRKAAGGEEWASVIVKHCDRLLDWWTKDDRVSGKRS